MKHAGSTQRDDSIVSGRLIVREVVTLKSQEFLDGVGEMYAYTSCPPSERN